MQEKFTIIHNILSLFGFFHLFPLYSAEKVPLSHSPQMQTLPPPHWFPGLAVFLPLASIFSAYGFQMESFPWKSRALRAPAACGMHARLIKTGRAWRDNTIKSIESF